MKRLIRENTNSDGSLNNDSVLRAVMQYRNTPDRDTNFSPAQVIFGRNLRDFLPSPQTRYKVQRDWIMLAEDREKALAKRAVSNMEKLTVGTRELPPLSVGDSVLVQNQMGNHPSKWDITGVVVEVKEFDQYVLKIDGSGRLTLRNRKFLRKITPYQLTKHFKSDMPVPPTPIQEPPQSPPPQPPARIPDELPKPDSSPTTGPPETPAETLAGTPPAPPLSPAPTPPSPPTSVEPRRSSRVKKETDRLVAVKVSPPSVESSSGMP